MIGLVDILSDLDEMVRRNPTQSGIGSEGLFQESDQPIRHSYQYEPEDFNVSVKKYSESMQDVQKRRRLETPICIMAFFTNKCQTNCIYCYAQRKQTPEMPLNRWRSIIREMQELNIKLISLDGGDVIARRDGMDFLEELIKADLLFLLSTKAYFSEEDVNRLVSAGFKKKVRFIGERKVQLSVDAWDNSKARYITGSSVFKRNIAKTFENFMSFGIIPKIKGVLMPINVDQPLSIVEYFYPRGARRFQFVKYTRSFYRHSDDLFLDSESIEKAGAQMREIRSRYPDIDLSENITQFDPYSKYLEPNIKEKLWANRSGCGGGWSMLGIAANGRAFLCEQMIQDEPFYVGDLNTQSIMDVWTSETMLNFIYPTRDKFVGTICYDCDDFEVCHWEKGYCYRNAYFSCGTIFEAPPLCPKQQKPGLRLS